MKLVFVALIGIIFGTNAYSISFGKSAKGRPLVSASLVPVCLCYNLNLGVSTNKSDSVGVNAYLGGLPFAGGGKQAGVFYRFFPLKSFESFFLHLRLGYMETAWGHPDQRSAYGPNAGIDIGNQWFYPSGFSQGVTWVGVDAYVKPTNVAGLPHGLRYEVGYRF